MIDPNVYRAALARALVNPAQPQSAPSGASPQALAQMLMQSAHPSAPGDVYAHKRMAARILQNPQGPHDFSSSI